MSLNFLRHLVVVAAVHCPDPHSWWRWGWGGCLSHFPYPRSHPLPRDSQCPVASRWGIMGGLQRPGPPWLKVTQLWKADVRAPWKLAEALWLAVPTPPAAQSCFLPFPSVCWPQGLSSCLKGCFPRLARRDRYPVFTLYRCGNQGSGSLRTWSNGKFDIWL